MDKTTPGFCPVTFLDKGNKVFLKKMYRRISPKIELKIKVNALGQRSEQTRNRRAEPSNCSQTSSALD